MSVVLIVDDEEDFCHLADIILQRAGYQTLLASDGREGLRLIDECHPDVVLLDDMMPGLSGGDLCRQLKSDPLHHDLPVIIHTAGGRIRTIAHSQAVGADALLVKPVKPQVMIETVGRLLNAVSVRA